MVALRAPGTDSLRIRTPLGKTLRRTSELPDAVKDNSARSRGNFTAAFITDRAYAIRLGETFRNTVSPQLGTYKIAVRQTGLSVLMLALRKTRTMTSGTTRE